MSRASLLVVLFAAYLPAAAPPTIPTPEQLARLVAQLGDDDFETRQVASARLRAYAEYAEPALEKAADSDDAEIKRRARAILNDFRRGIYPDTPDAVVELIRRYETVTSDEKSPLIRKLITAGRPGCRALIKLVRNEKDAVTRKVVFTEVFVGLSRAMPSLIESGNLDSVEGVLELGVQGDAKEALAHYAAFHLLRGTLPRQIAALERATKGKLAAKHEQEILASLHRAAGDLGKAVTAATEAERNDLVGSLLFEKADWKALNANPKLIDLRHPAQTIGYRAAIARLAGDDKAFLALLKDIIQHGEDDVKAKTTVLPWAKALMLNGRASDALALLKKGDTRSRMRYDLHAARLQVKEAFALVEEARKAESPELPELELAQARTLHQLGEKDKAVAIVKKYTEKIAQDDASWYTDLVETELALERRTEAIAVAAKLLGMFNDPRLSAGLFDKLFGEQAQHAASLWILLRRPPVRLEPEAALTKLRTLMEGKATKDDIDRLVTAAKNVPPDSRPEVEADHWLAAGEAAARSKHDAPAAECFRKAGTFRATLRLGDLEANRKEWLKASILYLQAYRLGIRRSEDTNPIDTYRENQPALALYLYGHALTEAGFGDDGRRRIEQAHLLPLGDVDRRYELMRDLLRRGHSKASEREQGYMRQLGEPLLADADAQTGEGFRALALHAAEKKQWLKAADAYEQSFLRVLHPELNFARGLAYVTVPAYVYRLRAQGLAKANRLDEAREEAKRNRDVLPGSVDLCMNLMPLFEAQGRKKDADDLYAATREPYDALLAEYPKAAWVYNQVAWLSAVCRRDLEKGLASAKRAVELAPNSGAYHDTLAEVLFQLGKKDEAVAAQKKAVALDPARVYFRKQLKRIEAGDPKAARPDEDE